MERTDHAISLGTLGLVALALGLFGYLHSLARWRARSCGRPLPPGPPSLPLVGNILNVPKNQPHVGYRELCAKYGDIMHFQVLGQHIVVLGSSDIILEYLDKRSANTSDRKVTPMLELSGGDIIFAFFAYGQWWRRHRRMFWQHFNPTASVAYNSIQRTVAHRFLYKILTRPSEHVKHVRYSFAASMMKIIYDNDVESEIEEQMIRVQMTQDGISQGLVPGKYLVEFFPFIRHLPSWFLGAELRVKSTEWRNAANDLKNIPYNRVIEEMVRTAQNPDQEPRSIISQLLAKISHYRGTDMYAEEEDIVKNTGAIAFEAGADTMFSSLQTTFLAMSLNPDILKKAQAELDTVVGPNRLPDWDDQASLPYITAIVKESLRWQNVLPLSVPHSTTVDDELHGYFIPAGTIVIGNTWACMHDPQVYEDPDVYRPERFLKDGLLDPTVRDPFNYAFGYGRRVCPGRHFAEASLFINTASLLHVFNITPPLDEDGKPIKIAPAMTDGIICYPVDARCTIKPRSAQAEALILGARAEAFAENVQ
ncbi:O-methylsterigmatocystin oxidoreductase [Polyporus arcularius HHB13444]|uniref:O-methylsterigmatocystin oxidoreductase n=1 Tax=Polyporus arcularius HHB13444 TaxID=1314778 RepID=A0A5C3Q297_9APHY|nr:O-methylsterigmatocystin oxidoreductase [Polyporus arcularius HHB13444]